MGVVAMARRGFSVDVQRYEELRSELERAKSANDYSMVVRVRALLLVNGGSSEWEAAAILDVGRSSVQRWIGRYRRGGVGGLRKGPFPGSRSSLPPEQKEELASLIEGGPENAGLDTGVWTAPIIADLVKRRFGVSYSASQIRRILHGLGFSLQFPRRKLSGADRRLQANWLRNELPKIKKKSVRLRES
jgi:putative transposase